MISLPRFCRSAVPPLQKRAYIEPCIEAECVFFLLFSWFDCVWMMLVLEVFSPQNSNPRASQLLDPIDKKKNGVKYIKVEDL